MRRRPSSAPVTARCLQCEPPRDASARSVRRSAALSIAPGPCGQPRVHHGARLSIVHHRCADHGQRDRDRRVRVPAQTGGRAAEAQHVPRPLDRAGLARERERIDQHRGSDALLRREPQDEHRPCTDGLALRWAVAKGRRGRVSQARSASHLLLAFSTSGWPRVASRISGSRWRSHGIRCVRLECSRTGSSCLRHCSSAADAAFRITAGTAHRMRSPVPRRPNRHCDLRHGREAVLEQTGNTRCMLRGCNNPGYVRVSYASRRDGRGRVGVRSGAGEDTRGVRSAFVRMS